MRLRLDMRQCFWKDAVYPVCFDEQDMNDLDPANTGQIQLILPSKMHMHW